MTLSEALGEGLQVTAIGLIIVFSVLIILMLVMMLMKVVFYRPEGEGKKAAAPAPAEAAAPAPAAAPAAMNDDELIAVLTAAVVASLNTSTYHLNIKSYRRIENTSPAWNKAGLRDVIDARF